jgi:hypothetical protein
MNNIFLISIFIIISIFTSCRKQENIPSNNITIEYDNRDQFVGIYKVYDTTGVYLYNFEIEKKIGPNGNECPWDGVCDSLLITNFANNFDVAILHQKYFEGNYLDIGVQHPILDYLGNRWHLSRLGGADIDNFNQLNNDTLLLYFQMSNIAFYLEDSVPYYDCICEQTAIKQ